MYTWGKFNHIHAARNKQTQTKKWPDPQQNDVVAKAAEGVDN